MTKNVFKKINPVVGIVFLFFLLLSCGGTAKGREHSAEKKEQDSIPEYRRLRFLFLGDIMSHKPQVDAAWDGKQKKHDFKPVFDAVSSYFKGADLVIGNLETTFGGEPYTGYPTFSSPDILASDLRDVGVDILTTANNHTCDRGNKGVIRTLDILDGVGIRSTGSFRSEEDYRMRNPLVIDTLGVKIAFLAYTYGTNGIPFFEPVKVNLIDTIAIKNDLEKVKALGADFIIASMHWGIEYSLTPSGDQKKEAQWLADNGVDAIVGMHPHVVQPSDTLLSSGGKSVPVVYSLGNFISNQYQPYTRLGKMLSMQIGIDRQNRISIEEWKEHYTFVARRTGRPNRYLIVPVDSIQRYRETFSGEDRAEWERIARFLKLF